VHGGAGEPQFVGERLDICSVKHEIPSYLLVQQYISNQLFISKLREMAIIQTIILLSAKKFNGLLTYMAIIGG
jgi:hypothetical protein